LKGGSPIDLSLPVSGRETFGDDREKVFIVLRFILKKGGLCSQNIPFQG